MIKTEAQVKSRRQADMGTIITITIITITMAMLANRQQPLVLLPNLLPPTLTQQQLVVVMFIEQIIQILPLVQRLRTHLLLLVQDIITLAQCPLHPLTTALRAT